MVLILAINTTPLAAGCDLIKETSVTAPSPQPGNSGTLLARVRQLGYNAERISYGGNAARIAINGDVNWNFLVNGSLVGISFGNSPSIDVSAITVAGSSSVIVRRPT